MSASNLKELSLSIRGILKLLDILGIGWGAEGSIFLHYSRGYTRH